MGFVEVILKDGRRLVGVGGGVCKNGLTRGVVFGQCGGGVVKVLCLLLLLLLLLLSFYFIFIAAWCFFPSVSL